MAEPQTSSVDRPLPLVGDSIALVTACESLLSVAPYDINVLIEGETGTGKELFARALHDQSPRRSRPFVAVNCAALPLELLESELFGHRRGAFTHAVEDRRGLIAEAERGTLFLDEIGTLALEPQAKLLRFLQEQEYRRVGADHASRADVRVVAATNEKLEQATAEGRFRLDLYYRLRVYSVRVPPLRERREDVPLLLSHFLGKYGRQFRLEPPRVPLEVLDLLVAHDWPGNVRELENLAQRISIRCAGRAVQASDLQLSIAPRGAAPAPEPQPESISYGDRKEHVVRSFERAYLVDLMKKHHGNVSRAAATAGRSRRALIDMLKRNDVDPRPYRRSHG